MKKRVVSQPRDGTVEVTPPLQTFSPKQIAVRPVTHIVAREICEKHHYLGSYPGGSMLNFGIFVGPLLLGVAVIGAGPSGISQLFRGAGKNEVVCLSRLWLDDRLNKNCESRVLAIVIRALRRHTNIKAMIAYSDPVQGHSGTIYRAAGFAYIGESFAMPLYRLPGDKPRHSRSLSHSYGTHGVAHFSSHGINLEVIPQSPKLTYVALIDPLWRDHLTRPILPYLKGA